MFADKPHRLNGRTSAQRFCVLTILPPVTALAVGLPAQRAIAQRFRALALFGPHAMSDLSPECAPKRTSAGHSGLMGLGSKARAAGEVRQRSSWSNWEVTALPGHFPRTTPPVLQGVAPAEA